MLRSNNPPTEFIERCGFCKTRLLMDIQDYPVISCPKCGWEESLCSTTTLAFEEELPNDHNEG